MRLFVFICLLLASTAVPSPNERDKRHLSYLKDLIKSAISGSSQINIQPQAVLQEENGYKLFRLPGYDDVMIKVTPKKPVVEEFEYPPAVKQVNLNAFGSVVGTKSKENTLKAVKEVNNLLSTGILYGGQHNVIETRPVLTEVIESRPIIKEVIETKPVLTEVIRPLEKRVYPSVVKQVNLNSFGSVVDTNTKEDALVTMKKVNNLLPTSISYESRNNVMKETVTPMFPLSNTVNYIVEENIKTAPVLATRRVLTEVIESRPIFKEVIETKPALTEIIRPLEDRVELKVPFEPIYSYTQMQNNEPMLTYTGHTIPGVEVLETLKMKTELPVCVKKRVDEAIVLAANPNRFTPGEEVFQYQSAPVVDFTYPRVETASFVQSVEQNGFAPVQEIYQYQAAPVMDFSYPRTEANSYLRNSERKEMFTKGFETVSDIGLAPQTLSNLKENPVHYNLRPTEIQEINPRPMPFYKHKSLHIEENISASKDRVNSQTKKLQPFNYLGKKVDIAQTLGPIPSQYITHQANKSGDLAATNKNTMKVMKAVPIEGSKDSVANVKIPTNVYKTESNPNTVKVIKESNALRTNVESDFNQYIATHVLASKKGKAHAKNVVFTNKVVAKPPSITRPVIVTSTNSPKLPLRENIQTSVKSTALLAKDNKSYTYQQKNANGSSLNVKGDKHGVSVNVEKDSNRGRGDIPDQ